VINFLANFDVLLIFKGRSCMARDKLATEDSDKSIVQILKWLFQTYGARLHLPKWDDALFHLKLAALAGLTANGANNLIHNGVARPKTRTREKLADVFKPVIAHIHADWFLLTLEEFQARAASGPINRVVISVAVPNSSVCSKADLKKLCGAYVCYRYSIDHTENRCVAREVLQIFENGGHLRFSMSFRTTDGNAADGELMSFEGIILPIGQGLFFVGWEELRGRSLFFRWDRDASLVPYHFGMLSSTKRSWPYYPIAACTVIIKLNYNPANMPRFLEKVTKIQPFDEIIKNDFGEDAINSMQTFLSNSLDSIRTDGNAREERVLRINEDRFSAKMPELHRAAMAQPKSPLRREWGNAN
jgi:hypothetical protein